MSQDYFLEYINKHLNDEILLNVYVNLFYTYNVLTQEHQIRSRHIDTDNNLKNLIYTYKVLTQTRMPNIYTYKVLTQILMPNTKVTH